MGETERDPNDRRLEQALGNLLRIGVIVAAVSAVICMVALPETKGLAAE